MTKLNDRQREAVRYIDGPLLVLAGAGSGKTSVITRKIAYLVEHCGYQARHMVAVTFTNKAAKEMQERTAQLMEAQQSKGLKVSTFHNLGLTIIRKEHAVLGYRSGFSLFDQQDAVAVIKDLLIQHDTESDQADIIQHQISAWKNAMKTPEEVLSIAKEPLEILCGRAYEAYQRSLKAYNALDFDDLLLLPVRLFQEHPDVLARWQQKIRYMLVDEYQDTNISQYELVRLLVGHSGRLTVVGDDDQSIYSWRGARPENMEQLKTDFPNLKVIKLEQNYRSTPRILNAANKVIDNNPHVFEKKLWSDLGFGDPVRVVACRNEDAECERVVTEILDHKLRSGYQYGDYAILYRGNHQSRLLELKLQHHKVPYQLSGGTSFFARQEIKDIMAYLKLLINPDDDNAFLRIINTPRRKIGATTLEGLGQFAQLHNLSFFEACQHNGLEQHINEAGVARLRGFHQWFNQLMQNCYGDDPIAAIREMISDIDYEAWLHQNSSSSAVADRRFGNVLILIDSLANSLTKLEEDDEDEDAGIEAAIARLVLRDLMERQEDEEQADHQVRLMTLHASKGLEFPIVYILGLEEEILPHRNSIESDTIEEERRLFYVGITRAKKNLTLTYSSKRKQFGEIINCIPSRFLDELPDEDIVREGGGQADAAENVKKGNATLAGLKNLFDD